MRYKMTQLLIYTYKIIMSKILSNTLVPGSYTFHFKNKQYPDVKVIKIDGKYYIEEVFTDKYVVSSVLDRDCDRFYLFVRTYNLITCNRYIYIEKVSGCNIYIDKVGSKFDLDILSEYLEVLLS